MFETIKMNSYKDLHQSLHALLDGETNRIANLSNASALLNEFLEDINWVGFYLYEEESDELVLGPFQGRTACVRIKPGNGVCGLAYRGNDVFVVDDVTEFPGHIACDARSRSEIVVPIYKDGVGIGVLDVDSPSVDRFTEEDRLGLIEVVEILKEYI